MFLDKSLTNFRFFSKIRYLFENNFNKKFNKISIFFLKQFLTKFRYSSKIWYFFEKISDLKKFSDIDECDTDVHNCHINAWCTNTDGSYYCACNIGYNGNGLICEGKLCLSVM